MSAVLLPACPGSAKIIKYQKNGVWYYTDTPTEEVPKERQEMPESNNAAPPPSPGGTLLLKEFPARNAIEKAATATVTIKTAIGYGSGFFISPSGYIVTNKHVVRTLEHEGKKIDDFFDKVDRRAEDIQKQLADEKKRLEQYQDKLKHLKKMAENESDKARKKSFEDEYQYRKQEYESWENDYRQRKKEFQSQLKQYESGRGDYNYSRSVTDLSQSFKIVLVDDTELYARLVAVSEKHDLALLKLDGYQTPALRPGNVHQLAQGDQVYAIGNPADLHNTVTSGIFSGYEGAFIQTNAQINPGNSGGPLVDSEGRVLGINTKKKIGNAIEGLGFAIPIKTALDEFSRYLH